MAARDGKPSFQTPWSRDSARLVAHCDGLRRAPAKSLEDGSKPWWDLRRKQANARSSRLC